MRKNDLEILGFVLANPIRRIILESLVNPQLNPKSFRKIQKQVSNEIGKRVTDGSLSWYLKDLLANDLIEKSEKQYSISQSGEKIISVILTLS